MLDYVFFLGIAAYLAIDARYGDEKSALGLTILRVMTGVSFLWVGVEKWSYPSWTYEILRFQLKSVLMGFEPEFFVMAAGFVEFCLAFLLIVGRFSSQVAAGVLFSLLILAMPAVGLIDAIGHLPLVIVLALLAGTENSIPMANGAEKSNMMANSIVGFTVCVPGLTSAYYLAHEFAYRGQGITDWVAILAFTPLISLFVLMAVCKHFI